MDKKLLDYINSVIELERSVYTSKEMIAQLRKKQTLLAIPNQYTAPVEPAIKKPIYKEDTDKFLKGILIVSAIFAVLSIFGSPLILLWLVAGIPGVIAICNSSAKKANEEAKSRYDEDSQKYKKMCEEDAQRVQKEKTQIIEIEETISLMEEKQAKTEQLLRKYYALNIIYPKYRNFAAMCSIYEYLESGKCDGLTGPDGAYNKFDDDAHWEKIYTKIDQAIQRMDQLRGTQYVLYQAIQEGNRISQGILNNTLTQIELGRKAKENAELAAYYQKQAAEEARKTNDLLLYGEWGVDVKGTRKTPLQSEWEIEVRKK